VEQSVAVVEHRQYQTTGKRLCKLSRQQMANVINREIILEEFQQSTNVTDGQTTCHRNTALCVASCGNEMIA